VDLLGVRAVNEKVEAAKDYLASRLIEMPVESVLNLLIVLREAGECLSAYTQGQKLSSPEQPDPSP
jgi:hypothetical protein